MFQHSEEATATTTEDWWGATHILEQKGVRTSGHIRFISRKRMTQSLTCGFQNALNYTRSTGPYCKSLYREYVSTGMWSKGLNHVNQIIDKTGYRYQLQNERIVTHHFYMDDRSKCDIDLLMNTTRMYSNNTGMSFVLENCSWMATKRGNSCA